MTEKPEPLTKELAQKIFDILKEPDDNIAKHLKIALFVKYEIIKPRVEWLLKEIEKSYNKLVKEQRKLEDKWDYLEDSEKDYLEKLRGALECLEQVKDLIKKAFRGVIEK